MEVDSAKRERRASASAEGRPTARSAPVANGRARVDDPGLARLEHAMQAAAAGDFTVRLPARRKDDIGRLEAAFNQMAARNAALEAELVRVGRDHRPRGPDDRARPPARRQRRLEHRGRLGQRPDRRPGPPDHRGRARDRRGRRGRPEPEDGARDRGPAGQGRVRPDRHHGELDGRPALELRRRGDPRGARGRHRRQARRPGRRSPASPAPGRTSPTRSTSWPRT